MEDSNRLLKVGARFFIAFLASVFLVCFMILLTLRLTLFDENYIEKQAVKTEYYQQLTTEINQQIENSLLGSNIPKGVLATTVSEKDVKNDVNQYFKAMYDEEKDYTISSASSIKSSTSTTLKAYIEENQLTTTDDIDQVLTSISDQIVDIYRGYVELPFIISYGQKMMNYKSQLVTFMIVCGLLWLLMSIALYSSLKGYFHRLIRYWAYIFMGSGLMMTVFPGYILLSGLFSKLAIESKAMYDFIQAYLSSFLWLFIYIGGISLVLGLLCIVISEFKRKNLFSK